MAAYAAVVSLMHLIDDIEHHLSPPISIDKQQLESLSQTMTFLQEFLDHYNSPFAYSNEADPLEMHIAEAAYAAEDVIESRIVDMIKHNTVHHQQIYSEGESNNQRKPVMCSNYFGWLMKPIAHGRKINYIDNLYQALKKVIKDMDLVKKEAMNISVVEAHPQRSISTWRLQQLETAPVDQLQRGLREVSSTHVGYMVGFDQVFLEVLDKLTGGQLNCQIIPIMGMGGIGKTTLTRNLFENALVKEYFDIRAWITISQTYNVRGTLREILFQASGDLSDLSEDDLGEKLYKYLSGRRYLIVIDDMWSIEVWNKIKFFFPNHQNESRIIITTRLSNLGSQLNEFYTVGMKFLDEASSWGLFCKTVFGKENCPLELESVGKNIVANCKGLPLSIAMIGGLLSKSECTVEYWVCIEQNLNSIVINSNDEFCLKTLRMSYIYLPNYLKPCFLYMGIFEEDRSICVSMLKKLWVSEGFLKPRSAKCLETIAQEYLKELVDRNLILVDKVGSIGNVKYCKIHDLVRDLCLKEVEKEKLYHVIRDHPRSINSDRRVVFPIKTGGWLMSEVMGSLSHVRSIIHDDDSYEERDREVRLPHNIRLLRTFKAYDEDTVSGAYFLDNVFELVNLRYLAVNVHKKSAFPTSVDLLWNLQTLIIHCWEDLIAPTEIWKLHQLRHLEFRLRGLILPDPPSGDNDIVIMKNLQTLKGAKNLILNEGIVKRIPDVKNLHLRYQMEQMEGNNGLSYLQCLNKLENFCCSTKYGSDECWQRVSFPHSLKKLSVIASSDLGLEDILQKVSSLPFLEKLVLKGGFFKTCKWETIGGQFRSLKFLHLRNCDSLEDWIVSDNSHFPLLQKLCLDYLRTLKEIPSEIGEIPTLRSIKLDRCSESVVVSAKNIVEEQEDLYGDQLELHVRALVWKEEEALKSLANANFEVKVGINRDLSSM